MIKRNDLLMTLLLLVLISVFLPFNFLISFHENFLFAPNYWWLTSFLKFGILATIGESIGLRITTKRYNYKGFGLIPRAIVWGILGVGISIAFTIFSVGTPILLEKQFNIPSIVASMQAKDIFDAMNKGIGLQRLIAAFAISVFMNLFFAPVFMTFHKITDTHILRNGGSIYGFFRPIQFKSIFPQLNWTVQWNFVFKKTIPLFWIPAHTITFLLPTEYRIIFAALLGVILGIILAIGVQKSK
jgi:hypothetical protein